MPQPTPARALLQYALVATPIAVLIFLVASSFFAAWDGHVVSAFPPAEGARKIRVLIDDGVETRTEAWPAPIVESLEVPYDARGIPPSKVPDTAPHTEKSRFSLHFLVQGEDDSHDIVPTTSPQALTVAFGLWILGLFVRNMAMGGSPFELVPSPTVLPAPLPPAGQPQQPSESRPKKGPPPPRSKRRRR